MGSPPGPCSSAPGPGVGRDDLEGAGIRPLVVSHVEWLALVFRHSSVVPYPNIESPVRRELDVTNVVEDLSGMQLRASVEGILEREPRSPRGARN